MSRAKNFVHSQILKQGAAGFFNYFKVFQKKRGREILDAQKTVTAKIAKIGPF